MAIEIQIPKLGAHDGRSGPGMPEMLTPTNAVKSKKTRGSFNT